MKMKRITSIAAKGFAVVALAVACVGGIATADAQASVRVTGLTESTINIAWDACEGASEYDVYLKESGESTFVYAGSTSGTSGQLTNLGTNREYDIKVTYSNGDGYAGTAFSVATVPTKINKVKIGTVLMYIKKAYLVWDKRSTADGYQIQYVSAKGKKKTVDKTYSYNELSVSLDPKQFYSVKVRSYVKLSNGTKVYSSWSPTRYVNLQQQPKAKYVSGMKAKISWSKVKGAKNYTVYGSYKAKSGYKKLKTTKGKTVTISKIGKKKLKKHKYFYIYVVANKKVGKTTYKTEIANALSCYIY